VVAQRSEPPLSGRYPASVALALIALSPFIVLSTATQLVTQQLMADLHTSMFGVQLADSLANAGYAFGAVAAADLIQRMPSWGLYVASEAGFCLGSLLAAAAPNIALFTTGRSVQGITTGILLVAALPPLVTRHGAAKVPLTAALVNLGLFGMVTIGPAVGGIFAAGAGWRLMLVVVSAFGVIGVVLGTVAFQRDDDRDPGMGFDWSAIPIALVATVLPFLGVAWLSRSGFGSPLFYLPVIVGCLALVYLLIRQYRKDDPLMPLTLIAHTLPVTGIATAMVTGATVTAGVQLSIVYLLKVRHEPPAVTGVILAAEVAGVLVAAWLFKRVLRTRWLPAFALTGLGAAGIGSFLLALLEPDRAVLLIVVGGVLLGFAAGAGVSPGLFMAGLSAPSTRLGPTFAMVELLRSEAAFLIAPVLLQLAMMSSQLEHGLRVMAVILVVLSALSEAIILAVLLLGGARPHAPDLERWVEGEEPAYDSPPLAARVRDL
jgi:MFS family permease